MCHRKLDRFIKPTQAAGACAEAAGLKSHLEHWHTVHRAEIERLRADSESLHGKMEAASLKVRSCSPIDFSTVQL